MCPTATARRNFLLAFLVVHLLLIVLAAPAPADVSFYFQREGSPDDDGEVLFGEHASDVIVQDFEDPELGPDGAEMSTVPVGDMQLNLTAVCPDGEPFVPFKAYVSDFYFEYKLYATALISFSSLTFRPHLSHQIDPRRRMLAIGAWIYDDGGALDSAYQIDVIELDGNAWQAVLENEIPLDSRHHEIEGFFGVISDVGIAQVTITAIDPETGQVNPDTFEVDYLRFAEVPQCQKPETKPWDRRSRRPCFGPHRNHWFHHHAWGNPGGRHNTDDSNSAEDSNQHSWGYRHPWGRHHSRRHKH